MIDPSLRILVTGGAGFIGCHICEVLIERGHFVLCADNLLLGNKGQLTSVINHPRFTFVEQDVSDRSALSEILSQDQFDAVFHMAANSDISLSHSDPSRDYTHTLATTHAVLEAMRLAGVPNILFASSSAVYGEAIGAVSENDGPLLPISHYGAAKLASEAMISAYVANYGMKAWIFRFPNVVGDRLTHGAVFDFVHKLRRSPELLEVLGDGNQIKPYIDANDLVAAMMLAWDKTDQPINLFNIAGETRCSVRQMADIVVEEAGARARVHYTGGDRGWVGDVPSVAYDTARIRALGWEPRLEAAEAVRAAARWALDNL